MTWCAWLLEMDVRQGRENDVRELMHEMVDATEANEPGTLNYEWSFTGDGRVCHLYERYASSDAAMIHCRTFDAKFAARFLDVLTPTRFTFYGSPSHDVQEAAAPFGPVVMHSSAGVTR
ncbi:MAG: antibiotic biosynthesis monooxygenase [Acidobacteria bacterium]|nr:antibiotic biosynthesis monooxygenase [Acidobacteriota bacterium]